MLLSHPTLLLLLPLVFAVSCSLDTRFSNPAISPYSQQNVQRIFLKAILDTFGTNGTLDIKGLSKLLGNSEQYGGSYKLGKTPGNITLQSDNITRHDGNNSDVENCQSIVHEKIWISSCITKQCYNSTEMLQLFNFSTEQNLDSKEVLLISPAILYQSYSCKNLVYTEKTQASKIEEAWTYGFLFVTIINICSLVGIVVLPLMNTKIYTKVLLFLVALAVGSLAGTGLLVLIPEGFEIVQDAERKHEYLWMGSDIMAGIYLFFLIERLLKLIIHWRKKIPVDRKDEPVSSVQNLSDIVCSVKLKTPSDMDPSKMKGPANHASASQCTSHATHLENDESATSNKLHKSSTELETQKEIICQNGITNHEEMPPKKPIRTVAWMIVFGDGFHNFIDGLSIGAAFTSSILTGVSVSVAVICEELPHELGDIAILLNSGITLKKALLFNLLSAFMSYIGLILGIVLGEITSAHRWIFGIAGGMFLYIALVDMIPEMNSVAEASENDQFGTWPLFFLQNIGMILGFAVILVISYYSEHITVFL